MSCYSLPIKNNVYDYENINFKIYKYRLYIVF